MIAILRKDPIARVVALLWLGTAALYFLPGVPADFLQRLGDRYSTLPLWPWAAAGCVFGLGRVTNPAQRRFWLLQAASFASLLVIEIPWALSRASDTAAWNIAAEWCYAGYYACQLVSAARTRRGAWLAGASAAAAAAALTAMALTSSRAYDSAWPSYLTYLAFDAGMVTVFLHQRKRVSARWAAIFLGLAVTSAVVFVTDVLDMFSYVEWIRLVSGMKTDILWTLPPLCYALVARLGRQRLDPSA